MCERPVADAEGYLMVDMDEVKRVERWRQNWDDDHTVDVVRKELETLPEATHRTVLHAASYLVSEPCPYAMPVEYIWSVLDLLGWTGDLMDKTRLSATDSRRVLWRVARENGGRIVGQHHCPPTRQAAQVRQEGCGHDAITRER
jgi:hypothetical protein